MRWSEEALLLREEMRRILAFLDWQARWWEGRGTLHAGLSLELMEGMSAYAAKQSYLKTALRTSFMTLWDDAAAAITSGVGADNEVLGLSKAASLDIHSPPTVLYNVL